MKFIRVGICALLVFAVAAHGAVEDWARAVLEIGTAVLFLVWALRACFVREHQFLVSPLLPPLFCFSLLVTAQWVLHRSASSFATRVELQLLLADLLLLFLATQVFQTIEDWRGFIWFAMIFGFVVALFGILQHLAFNGKLYWFREMRFGGIPFGPYVNRNHFAGLMELVIPLSLVPLALGKVRRERWVLVSLFAIVSAGALFLSASRGGIFSFAVELGALALWLFLRRATGRHLLATTLVLLISFLLVSWLGARQALERFSSMQSLEVTKGKRASMAHDTWRIFLEHPAIGTGLGTLPLVFPEYESLYDGKFVNHAHNDYLEALAETGIVGGLCCLWFLAALLLDSLRHLIQPRNPFASTIALSGLIACLGFLTHSLVDFNLHIPANAFLFFLLAHLATADVRRSSVQSAEPEPMPNGTLKH